MQFGPQRPTARLISLTPLIDVVFILLVFFMLAASFLDWRAVDLTVSSGVTATPAAGAAIVIGLRADGSVAVDAATVEPAALRPTLATRLAADRARPVVIRSDTGVPLQRAIDTLDLVRALGVASVSLSRGR
jgi:biopolymer transport protein ExbD